MKLGLALLYVTAAIAQPEYIHGDECLFCHRNDIGPTWQSNTHGISLRERQDAPDLVKSLNPPADVEFFLGSRHHVRFLKKDGYGKFDIFTLGTWDKSRFAQRCAGCHTTAVETATATFAAIGHDCYVCHGAVDLNHTKDTALMLLSKKRRDGPAVVTAICAQCHLRGGKSKSTGLPYPNQFVAGGNLFQDFQVNFAMADDAGLNAGDRHVYRNVRDVVMNGSETTCLSCHKIHGQSTERHRRVLSGAICLDCHNAGGPRKVVKKYEVHSAVCEY